MVPPCSVAKPVLDTKSNKVAKIEEEKQTIKDESLEKLNFETYKQLKEFTKEIDPEISKTEIYEKLLKPFKHEKKVCQDFTKRTQATVYI